MELLIGLNEAVSGEDMAVDVVIADTGLGLQAKVFGLTVPQLVEVCMAIE